MHTPSISIAVLLGVFVSCRVPPPPAPFQPAKAPKPPETPPPAPEFVMKPMPGERLERRGDEIVVCGQLFHTTTPVVLWLDSGGYDAYRLEARFENPQAPESVPPAKTRFGKRPSDALSPSETARLVEKDWDLALLRKTVQQIVIHYDAAGRSRDCFRILHDKRGLSTHFLLDLDGTIYQTLDLKEMAWHAGKANARSVGIEIANVGAYDSLAELETLADRVPQEIRARGARLGSIRERKRWQYDFTPAQMEALAKLCATLCRVFPEIRVGTPASLDRFSSDAVLSEEELSRFRGILGHQNVHPEKVDPGPAFPWDDFLLKISQENFSTLR